MKPKLSIKAVIISAIVILSTVALSFALLLYFGVFHLNSPSPEKYPIRGVDLSSHQGEVDFEILASQDIDFVFIKATEGSTFVDPRFKSNYKNAMSTDLYVGAYHFFSFESSGKTQAQNFIDTVDDAACNAVDRILPPVIDVEYYGDASRRVPVKTIIDELSAMCTAIEEHYGTKPILYVTKESYNDFVKDNFTDNLLWIRSVYSSPDYAMGEKTVFWQYSNRHRLDGYNGEEKYIDMNLFYGDKEKFSALFD